MSPEPGSATSPATPARLSLSHGAAGVLPRSASAQGGLRAHSVARRLDPLFFSCAAKADDTHWLYSDSHFHPTNYIQEGRSAAELVADMDRLRIRYATMMPIPTNVLSSQPDKSWKPLSGQHHCGPSYYLPERLLASRTLGAADLAEACEATELYMNTGVDASTALRYRALPTEQQKRLDPMITGLHIGDMHSSTYLLKKLHEFPGVFTGVGEITVHKEVVEQLFAGKRQANLEDNVAPLCKLLETCGGIGMPVVLHCDITTPGAQAGDAPAYWAGIQQLFTDPAVSATTIVWAHAGGLGRFVNAPEGHVAALRGMLADSRYAHVQIDLSWLAVADKLVASSAEMAQWVGLIEAFPTRFLYGSDALAPRDATGWNQTYAKYQSLLPQLTPACRTQVCTGNYQRIFLAARKRVRAFERFFLPGIIADLQKRATAGAASPAPAQPATPHSFIKSGVMQSPEKQRQ